MAGILIVAVITTYTILCLQLFVLGLQLGHGAGTIDPTCARHGLRTYHGFTTDAL